MRDGHNDIKYSRAISPAAATTDNTAFVSTILETAGFGSNEFVLQAGSIADADATFTALLEEGDQANLSDAAAVAAADMIGTLNGTITAGSAVTGFKPGFADDDDTFKIGYRGRKRYIRMTITPAANTGNIFLAAVWAQGRPTQYPQSAQRVAG